MINLLNFFRYSLYQHILDSGTHTDTVSHAIDFLATGLLEFKAFGLFSLTFGIGVAVQEERAALRGVKVHDFLLRRFLVLLIFGAVHMLLIANVDILTLYSVCGLMLIPLLRLPSGLLAILGIAALCLPSAIPQFLALPADDVLRAHAAEATRIYSGGGWIQIFWLRWRETRELIVPLLLMVTQRTLGLMMIGVAVWRFGVVRDPHVYRIPLLRICVGAGIIGIVNTTAHILWKFSKNSMGVPAVIRAIGSDIPLVFAYAAGLLLWRRSERALAWTAPIESAGRMALSNYLAQSIIFKHSVISNCA